MSRFIDNLKRLSQAAPQSIGFRTTQPAPSKLKIQLVAALAQEHAESMTNYLSGADAGLLRISKLSSGAQTLQKVSQTLPDILWGGWLGEGGPGDIKSMTKAGCDFVVFPAASTPLAILQNDEVGKILEVEASLSEGLLRAVSELPIDAVFVASGQPEGYSLTWQHLMLFRRFAALLTKPLLVSIPSKVTAGELQALWEAGVNGVIIEVTAEQSQYRVKELRQVIDQLVFSSPRRREKMEPRLSSIGRESILETAEEEEEE